MNNDLVSIPLEALEDDDYAVLAGDEGGAQALPSDRSQIAQRFSALMGDDADPDGVAADLIDAGRDLVMWGQTPDPEAIAVVPEIEDIADPEEWLDALDVADLPDRLESGIERLCQATMARGGDDQAARASFVRRLGDLFRQAGVEALHMGDDWVVLNAEDLANESDGEQYSPVGGFDKEALSPIHVGVSLGMGGRVMLWPAGDRTQLVEAPESKSTH